MKVIQDIFLIQIGNYLLETQYDFSLGRFHLVLLPDLIKRDSGGWFFPLRFRQFKELVENEAGGLLFVPAIDGEPAFESFDFSDKESKRIFLPFHRKYYK